MSKQDLCSLFNLSGIEATICKTLENTPITANLLYKLFEMVEPKVPLLISGIEEILKKNATKIFIYDTIMQQLPWLISFLILITILWFNKTISIYLYMILFISVIVTTILIMAIYSYYYNQKIEKMLVELKMQMKINFDNFKKSGISLP